MFLSNLKIASLFSGGKDSTYSMYLAKKQGYDVTCLLSIYPKSQESHLLHYPNLKWTSLQSKSMDIPQLIVNSNSDETDKELDSLKKILIMAKTEYAIEGVVHGGIKSKFQKDKFEKICKDLDLTVLSPLWGSEPEKYMKDLLDANFQFILTSVTTDGLDDSWLGRPLGYEDLDELKILAKKFHFNLNFEGGEAESFVVNCPLFSYPIEITKGEKFWDGYRGRFEILEARLNYHVR